MPGVRDDEEIERDLADVEDCGHTFTAGLDAGGRAWCLEARRDVLRKLDDPDAEREVFAAPAARPALVAIVGGLVGSGVSILLGQLFLEPPGGGGHARSSTCATATAASPPRSTTTTT